MKRPDSALTLQNDAYSFKISDGSSGQLEIAADVTIPNDTLSVGPGMDGKPTHVVQTGPNIALKFVPQQPHAYTLTFSTSNLDKGQILDNAPTTSSEYEIEFPQNLFGAIATLSEGNSWDVTYKQKIDLVTTHHK